MPGYEPSFERFVELAKEATIVPIHREVVADGLTPVAAHATVGADIGSYLFESVVGGDKWARYSFVGFDPDVILRGVADRLERVEGGLVDHRDGVDPWAALREELARHRPPKAPWLPRFWGGAVGYVSYDAVRRFEPTVGAPLTREDPWEFELAIGGTVLVFDNVRHTLRVVVPALVGEGASLRPIYDSAVARIDAAFARLEEPFVVPPMDVPDASMRDPLPTSSFAKDEFLAAIEKAREHIRAGDIFQVVLAQRFEVERGGIDPFDLYRAMRVINPSPYMYFVRCSDRVIAGASPEILVRVEDRVAELRPIAGTHPRGKDEADDARIEAIMLADPKERAEHVMLVDLGRNDLGRISKPGTVRVTDQMAVERYSHVMHIVSNVVGELAEGRDALDVLRATFPAGTLSGAPKVRAMQIIDALEPVRRGNYGGAIGYIGFDGNMDMAIAIRTIVAMGEKLYLQAGAGLVEASVGEKEFEETVNKARAGLVAIGAARHAAKARAGMR